MAEFSEVMRQWRRMCVALEKAHGDVAYSVCPLHGRTAIYDSDGTEDYADIERKVMQWAAERPKPVYPTWFEVLEQFGVVGSLPEDEPYFAGVDKEIRLSKPAFTLKAFNPIPADIAEKLGIKPKEE